METLTGNKLIAEFMGIKVRELKHRNHTRLIEVDEDGSFDFRYLESYEPNSDWNTLIPVAAKIVKNTKVPLTSEATTKVSNVFHSPSTFLINKVWDACVDFIEWYNKTQTPQP